MILWIVAVPTFVVVMILATAFAANADAFPRAGRIGRSVLGIVLLGAIVVVIMSFTVGLAVGIVSTLFVGIPAAMLFLIGLPTGDQRSLRRSKRLRQVVVSGADRLRWRTGR